MLLWLMLVFFAYMYLMYVYTVYTYVFLKYSGFLWMTTKRIKELNQKITFQTGSSSSGLFTS